MIFTERRKCRAFEEDANLDDLGGLIASGSDNEEEDDKTALLLEAASIKPKREEKERVDAPKEAKKPKVEKPSKKKKKRKLAELATHLPADVNDSRFAALYSNSAFAIDKTHPQFKGGALADRQVQEKIRMRCITTSMTSLVSILMKRMLLPSPLKRNRLRRLS